MKKPIRFKKYVSVGLLSAGARPAGASMQGEYSVVTKRQEATIWNGLCRGRSLSEMDLCHFDDSHWGLIEHAIENSLLGDPDFGGSAHFAIVLSSAIRHSFDFGNVGLANLLLDYLLHDVDESYIDAFARQVLRIPVDPVAEIKRRYRDKIIADHAARLQQELARKPSSQDDSRPLKI